MNLPSPTRNRELPPQFAALPGETPLQRSRRIAAAFATPRPCVACGNMTRGSVGAAGIRWPGLCQPCKDLADGNMERQAAHLSKLCTTVADRMLSDAAALPPLAYSGALVAQDFAGISKTPPEPMPRPVAPIHLCPKCGEETPHDFIADRRICKDCGIDGEPPDHPCPTSAGTEMTIEQEATTEGPHGHGVTVLNKAGWACSECDHTEPSEG